MATLQKSEVRELARRFGLSVAGKQDSQDLCFLADGDYRRFLAEHSEQAALPGPILTEDGQELGQHTGLPFYTIGQRKRLGISSPIPLHVLHKDKAQNALVVGPRESLGRQTLMVRDLNWIAGSTTKFEGSGTNKDSLQGPSRIWNCLELWIWQSACQIR